MRRLPSLILLLAITMTSSLFAAKPRVIVLTDISNEPDDEESLVRFLVYSNEYDVEGIVATTSVWLRDKIRPDIIRETIQAYAQVRPNLLLHAPGFPSADQLLSVVKIRQHGLWHGRRRRRQGH